MDLRASVLGLVVGFLIGLTGMGGGAVMTPALILLGWVPPVVAVGTDLVWGAITRAAGAIVHHRQGSIDFTIVRRLALGSIPGALAGVAALNYVHHQGGNLALNRLVLRTLGIVLVGVAVTLLVRSFPRRRNPLDLHFWNNPRHQGLLTTLMGMLIGFLVSVSSVGSGSLIVACLIVLYPAVPLSRIVGSDILHALFLLTVAGLGHLGMGNINVRLLIALSIGSIPGVWLGSRLSVIFPERILRPVLAAALLVLGYRLI
jgi:uncharacterized membrane protein YfcA